MPSKNTDTKRDLNKGKKKTNTLEKRAAPATFGAVASISSAQAGPELDRGDLEMHKVGPGKMKLSTAFFTDPAKQTVAEHLK